MKNPVHDSVITTSLVIVIALGFIVWIFSKDMKLKNLIAFILGWILPGFGHIYIGKSKKGIYFTAMITLLFVIGMWLTNFRMVGYEDNPYYYIGQFGCGAMTLFGVLAGGEKAYPIDSMPLTFFDPGMIYVCVAGILNYVVAMSLLNPKAYIVQSK